MKSTLKIAFQLNYNSQDPVIKIIQPAEVLNPSHSDDVDPKDEMINYFLHDPMFVDRNYFFVLSTYFQDTNKGGESGPHISMISPVKPKDAFWILRDLLISQLAMRKLQYNDDKIREFFDVFQNQIDNKVPLPVDSEDILAVKPDQLRQNVKTNSIEFRKWLDTKGIEWESNEHMTTIIGDHDKYDIGFAFGKYYAANAPKN